MLDHPEVTWVNDNTGNNASRYPGYAYFIPANKIKVDSGSFGSTMVDRICLRYMNWPDGRNSRMHQVELGALAKNPTSGKMEKQVQLSTIEGLMMVGVQHFARLDMNDVANYQ